MSWRGRIRARNPLPTGASTVGIWMAFTGLVAYGFLAISAHALGDGAQYSALATLWALAFVMGPGFFLPVEQEIARALSHRRAQRLGGAPVVRKAAFAAFAFAGVLSAGILVLSPILADRLFDGSYVLVVGLVLVIFGYAFAHVVRGALGGNQRFASYGLFFGMEGTSRLIGALVLAIVGVTVAGPFGIVVGAGPFIGAAIAARRERGLLQPGPPAAWSELTQALAYLLVGSALAQGLINAAPIAAQVLAGPNDADVAGTLLNGLLVARIPLFFFQAVQASLVPELSGHRGAGRHAELVRAMRRILVVVFIVGIAATVGAALLGPWAVTVLFGSEFQLGSLDMALLAGASALLMLALALVQVLIALSRYRQVASVWVFGAAAFFVGLVVFSGSALERRVELAFLVATSVAAVAAVAFVVLLLRIDLTETDDEGDIAATHGATDDDVQDAPTARAQGDLPEGDRPQR